jgi:HEAT repeat protein
MRKKAVFLLSQKSSSETETLLIDVVKNDPSRDVRESAVFWLGQVHSDKAASALEDIATSSADTRLREGAIFALGQSSSSRASAFVRRIAENSESPESLREKAIFQLGQRSSAENADYLKSLFGRLGKDSRSEGLRKNVLFSLSQMRGFGNDKWLLNVALDNSQSEDVRKHALFCAGQAGVSSAELVGLYDKITDRELKYQLIWVMSDSRDRGATDKLLEIAQRDKDIEMRKKAIFWLGQKNDPRVKQLLIDIITKP